MAGRPRKPDAVKRVQGTLQKCRAQEPAPEVAALTPLDKVTPPAWLTPEAKNIFKVKAKQLISLRVLTAVDIDMLALYASSYAQAANAVSMITRDGGVTRLFNDEGLPIGVIVNPYVKIYNDALKAVNQIGGQFGFTPATRKAMVEAMPKEQGPKDDFDSFDK